MNLTLKKDPAGTWISLIKSKYASLIQVDVKCSIFILSSPPGTKPVTLARKCTTSITVTLQSPGCLLSQLPSLVWSIYSPSVCLKHTFHSRGKLISPSFLSALPILSPLLLPLTLVICHQAKASLFSSSILSDFEN